MKNKKKKQFDIYVTEDLLDVHRELVRKYEQLGREEYARREDSRLNILIDIRNAQQGFENVQQQLQF